MDERIGQKKNENDNERKKEIMENGNLSRIENLMNDMYASGCMRCWTMNNG